MAVHAQVNSRIGQLSTGQFTHWSINASVNTRTGQYTHQRIHAKNCTIHANNCTCTTEFERCNNIGDTTEWVIHGDL